MSIRGVNPKRWFYGVREALRADPSAARIFAGAACEQWLNGQIFSIIAEGLRGSSLTAYPEWNRKQHDCAVFRVEQAKATMAVNWRTPVAVSETKLLYLNYPTNKRHAYVRRILQQLAAKSTAAQRVGFVIGVYAWWPDERGPAPQTFREFRRTVGEVVKAETATPPVGFDARLAKPTMETLLDEQAVTIGAAKAVVGCVGQYVVMAPRFDEQHALESQLRRAQP